MSNKNALVKKAIKKLFKTKQKATEVRKKATAARKKRKEQKILYKKYNDLKEQAILKMNA
jgi:hypothetical protein